MVRILTASAGVSCEEDSIGGGGGARERERGEVDVQGIWK